MTEPSTFEAIAPKPVTYSPGTFVWHEMRTTEVAKAQAFYGALFGWTFKRSEMVEIEYHLVHLGDKPIAGMFNSTGHEMPPHWGSFISVPDVDAAAEATTAAGGQVCNGPEDIPGVGRFVMISDPQGAFVALYRNANGDPEATMAQEGEFCWDQLNTADMAAGAAFYQKVVGWTYVEAGPDMGIFKFGPSLEASCGTVPPGIPPHWLTFLSVANLAETAKRAESLGAKVLMANMAAGEWGQFSVIQDPAGAVIALFQGKAQ